MNWKRPRNIEFYNKFQKVETYILTFLNTQHYNISFIVIYNDQVDMNNIVNNNIANNTHENTGHSDDNNIYSANNVSNKFINEIGVSRRLGSSVLDELDNRTESKFNQLKDSTNKGHFTFDHSQLNRKNNSNPNSNTVLPLSKPPLNNHNNIIPDMSFPLSEENFNNTNTIFNIKTSSPVMVQNNDLHTIPTTPQRKSLNEVQIHSSSIKRLKKTPIAVSPAISEITRRIRKLRLRNSLTHGDNINYNSIPETKKLRNTPITKDTNIEPPHFLKPTLRSLNRITEKKKITPRKLNLSSNEDDASKYSLPSSSSNSKSASSNNSYARLSLVNGQRRVKSTGSTSIPKSNSISHISTNKTRHNNTTQQQRQSSQSKDSVFERLYNQSKVQRSSSMNNLNKNDTTKSKINFGRSKTSGSLAQKNDQTSSNNSQGPHTHKSIKERPIWR